MGEEAQLSRQTQERLNMARDTEFLHSFLLVEAADEQPPPPEPPPAASHAPTPQPRHKKGVGTFTQLAKELKSRRSPRRPRKSRTRRQEEVYTDKDRAAAVNMGSRDIKQSLTDKRKADRSRELQIPEEADPSGLLALGAHGLARGDVRGAIAFVHKALELNPNDKNALVARSKCYLLLGEPHLALQDAETALKGDKTFIRALFQKAEALYYLGDFEHSLMYFHRGQRLRPELEGFRLGVQKAQQAIENTIGTKPMKNVKIEEPLVEESKSMNASCEKIASTGKSRKEPSENSKHARNLLGELYIDKEYLEQLLKNPDINCVNQEGPNSIAAQAQEGIAFLNNREEFWRQQRASTNLHKKGKKRS